MHFKTKYAIGLIWLGLLMLSACTKQPYTVPLSEVRLELNVKRIDLAMYETASLIANDSTVPTLELYNKNLKPFEPELCDYLKVPCDSIADSALAAFWLEEVLSNKSMYALLDSVQNAFPADFNFNALLEKPLKRLKYLLPEIELPQVYTIVTGYDNFGQFRESQQIFINENYVGISLDYFMGEAFLYYPNDIPLYMRRRFRPEYLPVQLMHRMAEKIVPPVEMGDNKGRLLDHMIQAGQKLYFVDRMLEEDVADSLKLRYTASQMNWMKHYEGRSYREILPDIYAMDPAFLQRYILESPFTRGLDRGSAPRIGEYIGWKIVKAYGKNHPELSFEEIVLEPDYNKIFTQSKYRPGEE